MKRRRIIFIIPSQLNDSDSIWKDVLSVATFFKKVFSVFAEIWTVDDIPELNSDEYTSVKLKSTSLNSIKKVIEERNIDSQEAIVYTYGSWQHPTRLGFEMKRMGFKWVYNPFHGLKKAWSNNKFRSYWTLYEKSMVETADSIRVVDSTEMDDVKDLLPSFPRKKLISTNKKVSKPNFDGRKGNSCRK